MLAGPGAPQAAVEWIRPEKARGAVLFGGILSNDQLREFAASRGTPVVAVNQVTEDRDVLCINVDYDMAMQQVATHLVDLGHRRIALVTSGAPASKEKVRGLRQALVMRGLELCDQDVLTGGSATVEWGFQAMSSLLARPVSERPTAVVGACDLIALGVLHAVRCGQLSVPRDISVVGFDDIAMACHANPPLTTISPPKPNMGRLAVELILRSDEGKPPAVSRFIMLESPLIVRESTARVLE